MPLYSDHRPAPNLGHRTNRRESRTFAANNRYSEGNMANLLERVGGQEAVNAAVHLFYAKVLADSELAPFFKDSNMERQHRSQAKFLANVMDGSATNVETYMRNAHRPFIEKMNLNEIHFGRVAGHLAATLEELGVDAETNGEILTAVASLQDFVLDRTVAVAA